MTTATRYDRSVPTSTPRSSSPLAVVTGAARGIGAAISDRLATDGFHVVRLDRSFPDSDRSHDIIQCDVCDAESVHDAAAALAERAVDLGPVRVLVNNAGAWSFGPLEEVTSEEFGRILDVNLRGTFHCTQEFGRVMIAAGRGTIVNVVSIAADAANPRVGAYSASKAGVVALTRQTALEWGPHGIRVNAVGPGFVPTPGTGDVYDDPDIRRVRAGAVPLRRLGTTADVANAVAFLVSDQASYITGQVLYVDGGVSESLMTLIPRPGLSTPDQTAFAAQPPST